MRCIDCFFFRFVSNFSLPVLDHKEDDAEDEDQEDDIDENDKRDYFGFPHIKLSVKSKYMMQFRII